MKDPKAKEGKRYGSSHPNYGFGSSVLNEESQSIDASFQKHANMILEEDMGKTKQVGQLYDQRQNPLDGRIFDAKGECPAQRTPSGGNAQPKIREGRLRIRKLTPRECWRLMGVRDEDFDKLEGQFSDSTLYHLAGDSIVVSVLMEIFNKLMPNELSEQEVYEKFKKDWMRKEDAGGGAKVEDMYNPYNDAKITDEAPCRTTGNGHLTSSATILLKEK